MYLTLVKRRFAFSALIAFLLLSGHAIANPSCADVFNVSQQQKSARDQVRAKFDEIFAEIDGVLVTGASAKETLENLSLTKKDIEMMQNTSSRVVSIGEGTGKLLPELLRRGIHIKALDLWYHSPELEGMRYSSWAAQEMADYQNKYTNYLIRGSALNIPLDGQSIDVVLSQRLANNLHISEQLQFINETIRILSVGGQARILLTKNRVGDADGSDLHHYSTVLSYLISTYGSRISVTMDGGLLIIVKGNSTADINHPQIPFDPTIHYEGLPVGARRIHAELDAELLARYERTLKLAKEHPDDPYVQTDLRYLELRLRKKKSLSLHERSRFVRWWVAFSYKLFGR